MKGLPKQSWDWYQMNRCVQCSVRDWHEKCTKKYNVSRAAYDGRCRDTLATPHLRPVFARTRLPDRANVDAGADAGSAKPPAAGCCAVWPNNPGLDWAPNAPAQALLHIPHARAHTWRGSRARGSQRRGRLLRGGLRRGLQCWVHLHPTHVALPLHALLSCSLLKWIRIHPRLVR